MIKSYNPSPRLPTLKSAFSWDTDTPAAVVKVVPFITVLLLALSLASVTKIALVLKDLEFNSPGVLPI